MVSDKTVYRLVSNIPKGKVLTYGSVAKLVGTKNPRLIGGFLHQNPDPESIPCHRVVSSKGKVAKNFTFGGAKGQVERLAKEGVQVKNNRVDLQKYFWNQ